MLVLRWIYLVSMQPIVSGDYSSRISGKLFTYSKVTDILANPNWSYVHCQYIISLAHWSVESPVDRAGSHTVPFLPPHNSECPSSDRQDFTFIHDCALTATKLGFSPVPLSTFPKLDCGGTPRHTFYNSFGLANSARGTIGWSRTDKGDCATANSARLICFNDDPTRGAPRRLGEMSFNERFGKPILSNRRLVNPVGFGLSPL